MDAIIIACEEIPYNKKSPLSERDIFRKVAVTNRATPNGTSILIHKEMTLDLLFPQDQGSSIVDGINHLRNLILSVDLLMESLLSTLDSLLFCIFIIHPV